MAQTNFFSLPRELRDIIYAISFASGHYICKKKHWLFYLRLEPQNVGLFETLPLWLLASKQVMEEGLQHFYREAVCFYIRKGEGLSGGPKPLSLLEPQKIQHLQTRLDVDIVTLGGKGSDRDNVMMLLFSRTVGNSPDAHHYCSGMSFNAKSLTVIFGFSVCPTLGWRFIEEESPPFMFKFDMLEVYGQSFEKVRFEITQPYFNKFQTDSRFAKNRLLHLEVYYTAFQKEIQRWAVEKVSGPQKHAYAIRDWIERDWSMDDALVRYKWCFEARRTEKQGQSSVKYRGVTSYEYGGKKATSFGRRTEGETGLVEWSSDLGKKESTMRQQWLVDFANEGMEAKRASILGKKKCSS